MEPDLRPTISHRAHLFNFSRVPPISLSLAARHRHKQRNEDSFIPPSRHEIISNTSTSARDVESQLVPPSLGFSTHIDDRYNFLSSYKSPAQLSLINSHASHQVTQCNNTRAFGRLGIRFCSSALQTRRLHRFYESQNAAIERMLKTVEEHRADARREAITEAVRLKIAIYGSLSANIVLSALQVFAAVTSGSLSLITTMADAVFDPLSNVMLILTNRATHHVDPTRFPSGRARLETAGNILFCFIMVTVSVLITVFSVRELKDRAGEYGVNEFHLASVISVLTSFLTKLGLFIYCFTLRKRHSQVRIIWQDHRNDLLINGLGILTCIGGSKLIWWVDPVGATILSFLIGSLWLRTAWLEFMLLVGVSASVETHQLITYICLTHSNSILALDTIRVYYSGPRLIAEVDVVMGRNESLITVHDISEALQVKLESLPNIERSYVHVDYETTHKPEHRNQKE